MNREADGAGEVHGPPDHLDDALGEIRYAVRMIDGDPREGFVGIKDRLNKAENDIRLAREDREQFRHQQEIEEARHQGMASSFRFVWVALSFLTTGGGLILIGWIYHAVTGGATP